MATGVDLTAFLLFLLLSLVLALLKAFPVMIAGQMTGAKCLGYVWATGYFLLIFIGLSILKATIGTIYIPNIGLALLDTGIFMGVMWAMLHTYQIASVTKRTLFFIIGLLLNAIMMLALLYLLFIMPVLPLSSFLPH